MDTIGGSFSKVYMPWYWADLVTLTADITALSSTFYTNCSVDKFFNTLTTAVTVNGATSLIGRSVAALNFEIADAMAAAENPFASDQDKGCAMGKAIQAVFKW
jgi:hypothetical protein